MLAQRRITIKRLALLCRRMATQLSAGVDVRRAWSREAEGAEVGSREAYASIAQAVAEGSSLSDALRATGRFFPPFFRDVILVGEQTGHLAEVFDQMARHYDHVLQIRRRFLLAIAWPMVQLFIALAVIGFVIAVPSMITQSRGAGSLDLLGLGLTGMDGLNIYGLFLAGVAMAIGAIVVAVKREMAWTRPLLDGLRRIPGIGKCFQTVALSRLARSLQISLGAGMDLRRALLLSLRGTQHPAYRDLGDEVWAMIRDGHDLHTALARTGAFPQDFLHTVAVGEQSGTLSETLDRAADRYEDEARQATLTLAVILGFAVWGMVAILIIVLIFRIFGSYVGMIHDAASGF